MNKLRTIFAALAAFVLSALLSAEATWTYVDNDGSGTYSGTVKKYANQNDKPYHGYIHNDNVSIWVYQHDTANCKWTIGCGSWGTGVGCVQAGKTGGPVNGTTVTYYAGDIDLSDANDAIVAATGNSDASFTIIGQRCFYKYPDTSKFSIVGVPPTLELIDEYAFGSANGLVNLDCRGSVLETIGYYAFESEGKASEQEFWFPETLTILAHRCLAFGPSSRTIHFLGEPTESKLTGASVSLGQSLALNYYAVLTPAHTAAQMRFTYHGETTLVSGVLDEASGEYKFTFGRIPPQCMGDNVKAELILISEDGTETVLDVKETYSIREYCDDALAANPDNKALATLLADLLAYGDAAQDYANYNEDTPASDGFTVAPSEWEDVTDTDFTLSDKTREDLCFTSAGVRFGYINRLYFKIKAADLTGVTLTVNGKTYTAEDLTLVEDTADTYILYTDAIYATEFDKVFTAELSVDGQTVQTLTYSVKSYVYTKQNAQNSEAAALARALYKYGLSAIAYKNAQ